MDRDLAQEFALHWVSSWNAHDLDQILSHYTEDFEMSSPIIRERLGVSSGKLKGKSEIRKYWEKGLKAYPDMYFELLQVIPGASSLVILYRGHKGMSCEHFKFNEEGLVYEASAHYEEGSNKAKQEGTR